MTYRLGANGKEYVVIAAGGHPKIAEESLSDRSSPSPTLTDANAWTYQASGEEQPVQVTLSARRLFVPHTGSEWMVGNPYLGIISGLAVNRQDGVRFT